MTLFFVRSFILIQLILRLILTGYVLYCDQLPLVKIPSIIFVGLVKDVVTLLYFGSLIYFFKAIFGSINNRFAVFIFRFLYILLLLIISCAEFMFWQEYSSRFNFIAIDYVVYTQELFGTVKDTISLPWALGACVLLSLVYTWLNFDFTKTYPTSRIKNLARSCGIVLVLVACDIPSLSFLYSSNAYANELGKNGIYEFFLAFKRGSLDYDQFYITTTPIDIKKKVDSQTDPKKYNVVMVMIESMSASFMSFTGNTQGLTPNLDKLAQQGWFFSNCYATGTRTARGFESSIFSMLPIPGVASIKREGIAGRFNIGTVLQNNGYQTSVIYSGYSYFDNVSGAFGSNGYKVIDYSDFDSSEVTFANAWGVCDQDAFSKAIKHIDQTQQPFFLLIHSASNHRPFTFKQGVIDMEDGTREAAVKYADFAIGEFIDKTKSKPWFKNTIFVFLADHCASSAGKVDLPFHKYHIPLIFYAPEVLEPKTFDNMVSQIDIAPTLLDIMGFSYESEFFGQSLVKSNVNRAFISTYQLLGLIEDDLLCVLMPMKKYAVYKIDPITLTQRPVGFGEISEKREQQLLDRAVMFYQTASSMFKQ